VPEFRCRLGSPDGSILEQRRLAVSAEALRRELEDEGFHVFSVASAGAALRLPIPGRSERVKSQDFLLFNTQLKTLLRAGLPLAQSLELLKQQQADQRFRAILDKIHQQVTTGVALSDAFLSLGDAFPRLYGNSLRAGERSGELEDVLGRYVQYQRLVEAVRKKIVGALTYPAILILLALGLVVVLMTYVIPSFTSFYDQFGSELPLPTRVVVAVADFTSNNVVALAVGLVVLVVAVRLWSRTPRGRRVLHRLTLGVPVLGPLAHLFAMSQFSRSLSVLLAAGTPMIPALETASTSVNNSHVSEMLLGCVPRVQEGQALSETVAATGLAPDLALAMMRVGESTGALPEMLSHTSEFFDEEIDFSLNRIVTLIEPAIIVVMGFVVAGLLLAVYYPLLTLVSQIG
jgi:type IV pilus assembly protein PilC